MTIKRYTGLYTDLHQINQVHICEHKATSKNILNEQFYQCKQ